MYVVNLTHTVPPERIDELVPEHAAWLVWSYDTNVVPASGQRVPRVGGVIIVAWIARADLGAILVGDPFRQAASRSTRSSSSYRPRRSWPATRCVRAPAMARWRSTRTEGVPVRGGAGYPRGTGQQAGTGL